MLKGYRFIAVVPKHTSEGKIKLIKYFGGEVHYVDTNGDLSPILEEAKRLARELNAFMPNQFENELNIKAHIKTGEEIYNQTNGDIEAFVAGVGTGGTLIGIAKYLKSKNDKIKIYAVEPAR